MSAKDWRARLVDFDWVIVAAPPTGGTRAMFGNAQFAAMKNSAWLITVARGEMIEEAPLLAALAGGQVTGAFLDSAHVESLLPTSP